METHFWKDVFKQTLINIKLFTIAQIKLIGLSFILYLISFFLLGYSWWSILIAIGVSLLGVVPVLGSATAFIPWVLIELILGDPRIAFWLAIIFIGVEVIETLVEPFIIGDELELPFWVPALVTISLSLLFNVWGVLISAIILPFLSAYFYVRNRSKMKKR